MWDIAITGIICTVGGLLLGWSIGRDDREHLEGLVAYLAARVDYLETRRRMHQAECHRE